MGFWRGVGYFFSIVIIIIGLLLFPIGLIGVVLGFIFIWMLRRSAGQERMEKHLREINERDKARTLRENADRGKQLIDESTKKYATDLERKKKGKETKEISGGTQDAANMAYTTGYVAADVQDRIAEIEDNDEDYEDDDDRL